MQEVWKDIKGYEERYQISNFGRVKNIKTGLILKPRKTKTGYYQVHFQLNGKEKNYKVHRLVANEFISNPNYYKEINHKDENKANNCVSNLEWCDRKYNVNYGKRTLKTCKKIVQFDRNKNLIRIWPSINEARRNGFSDGCIIECCNGKRKTHKGYTWKYII